MSEVSRVDRARWHPCSPLWRTGLGAGRCRRHHYNDFGCPLPVCLPGKVRSDCTFQGSFVYERHWHARKYSASNRCSYLPEPVESCMPLPTKPPQPKPRSPRPKPRFNEVDLQNWAFAIMIALLFVSCGLGAVVDVYERFVSVPEKSD